MAHDQIRFPPGMPANMLRGGFGMTLKQIASPETYSRIFAPKLEGGPSGLADAPRPFVFRARHLDGRVIAPGEAFHFDVNVFDVRGESLAAFIKVFGESGPGRGRAELQRVDCAAEPTRLFLDPGPDPVAKVRIEFLTPTELKSNDRVVGRPEFPILFGRIRDRLSTLSALYGSGPLPIDFSGTGERSGRVKLARCETRMVSAERRSGRKGQKDPIGGLVGWAEYEGQLGEFLPFLEAARWTGVGRQTVWGKGEIAVGMLS